MNIDMNNNSNFKNLNFVFEKLSNDWIELEDVDDLNYVDDRGITLILLASINGNLKLVKQLLTGNNNVIYTDCYRRLNANTDPLHMAVKFQHFNLVKYLIEEKRALLDTFDSYGRTSLYYSVEAGNCELFKYLIMNGSNFELIKDNPFKLTVNSLNTKLINLVLPYLKRRHFLNYCPFSDLVYSYFYPTDLTSKLNMFNYLMKHPSIKIRQTNQNEMNLNNVIKFDKFRFVKLLILNHYDVDKFNLDKLFIHKLEDSTYHDKLLIVLKLTYYLGLNFRNVHCTKIVTTAEKARRFVDFNARNAFFGDLNSSDDQTMILLDQTDAYQNFLEWKSRKARILNLQQLSRISLIKHFNKNLSQILDQINYPSYLKRFLNLKDLKHHLNALDY